MTTQIAILHLMNGLADSSIGRIVQRLVQHLGDEHYSWHIGGLSGLGDMQAEFQHLGAHVVDFSVVRDGPGTLSGRIGAYVFANHVGLVHTHTPRARLVAGMALARRAEAIHLSTEHLLYAPRDRRWGLAYTLLDRFALYIPDHLVTVSRKMRRQVVSLPGIRANRVTTIQNAIDCPSYYVPDQRDSCRRELDLASEAPVIGYAGRIDRVKRLDLLLEGFVLVLARYPRARLLIAGEGSEESRLKALAAQLGVSSAVTWTGFRRDIPRLLAAMDIYVQPSVNEGLSLSILEAMAAGKPVIATDVGGGQEVIHNQESGLLIPSGSASAIGTTIIGLLDHPETCSALAQEGRSHAWAEFGIRRMVDDYQRLYETLALRLSSSGRDQDDKRRKTVDA